MLRSLRPSAWLLAALTLGAGILRFWQLDAMPLFGDEAYYLLWAQRLAPAYYDHPAGTALMLWLSTLVAGRGEFGVRWLNTLLSTACVPLAYLMGRRFVSDLGGWVAAAAVAFGPVYVLTGRVVYPDALQSLLVLVNLLALAPLLEGRAKLRQWVWFGLTLALLLNVRLTSAFYLGGLALYLLARRRDLLRSAGLWLAAALVVVGLLPVTLWNANHSWSMVRLAISQGQGFGLPGVSLLGSLAHAWGYLSPPMALLAAGSAALGAAALGMTALRPSDTSQRSSPRELAHRAGPELLAVLSACTILPVLLSAANSPRNLGLGLMALWPLTGLAGSERSGESLCRLWEALEGRRAGSPGRRIIGLALMLTCMWLAFYGVGTATALLGPTRLPHSPAADEIRWDAAGWPEFAQQLGPPTGSLIFAVDYSIAGQISYYAGRPAYSSMGQYRIWGVPEADAWVVLALPFIPPDLVAERLAADFSSVSEPRSWQADIAEGEKTVYMWEASGRRASTEKVIEDLDYLGLAQEAARRSAR